VRAESDFREPGTRVALVTGSSQGIGRSIAEGFDAHGVRVALHYHRNREAAVELSDRLPGSHIYQSDLSQEHAAKGLISAVLQDYGRIDYLINNAGVLAGSTTETTSLDDWLLTLRVNLTAPFLLAQEALRSMKHQGGGAIVNVASIAGLTGGNVGPGYAAAKAGLIGLTKYLARDCAKFGVRINAVAPTLTDTLLIQQPAVATLTATVLAANPMQRLARPDEIASVVIFLCSDGASFINGECVRVTGGP
jgi:NAD(P)-dependent dehydrogenase (short-subunit alcohol dehydrogenase family)